MLILDQGSVSYNKIYFGRMDDLLNAYHLKVPYQTKLIMSPLSEAELKGCPMEKQKAVPTQDSISMVSHCS